MAVKGTVCPRCVYVFRKFGVRCPICRHKLYEDEEDEELAIAMLAKKYLKILEKREAE